MCGIVGFHGFERPLVRDALAQLVHRGPDDDGVYADGPICLGMRRLSIIDVAGSQQPIFNEDRSLAIVFNGEIYNYQELQRSLAAKGHSFRTHGDTEMIVHLYEEYGPACVHLLRGMFAFAIWNTRDGSLFLARDRLGIKPLYYHWDGRRLAFASEIKALRVVPGIGRALDPGAIDGYLAYRYVPGPRTMYQDILKLQPGHTLILRDGELNVARYWAPALGNAYAELSRDEAAHEIYRLLDEAVRLHMIADVPLGVLLSSGIDSASLLGLMSQHSTRPVQAFTVGFNYAHTQDGGDYDETAQARAIAAHFGADYHEIHVTSSVVDLLPKLMWHFDQPVADPAALPTFQISEFARRSVTVALSGEGADELLGGYPRYYWATHAQRLQNILPPVLSRALVGAAAGLPFARSPERQRQLRLLLEPQSPVARHVAWTRGAGAAQRAALLSVRSPEPLAYGRYIGAGTSVHDLMRADLAVWLVDDVLTKADRMSMAASLELRVPFLDHRIVEFATALPEAFKQPFPRTKPLLRQAMRPLLPESVLGTRKRAFSVPIAEWLRGDLRAMAADQLLSPAHDHGLFDRAQIRHLWDEHLSASRNHAVVLWTLLCFETWYDEVFLRPERIDFRLPSLSVPQFREGVTDEPTPVAAAYAADHH